MLVWTAIKSLEVVAKCRASCLDAFANDIDQSYWLLAWSSSAKQLA